MRELPSAIPDVALLLALTPEELGAKMLFLLNQRGESMFALNNLEGELLRQPPCPYPGEKKGDISLVLSEAWAWLTAQGLLVPESGTNGHNGWFRLSRRARAMETEADFTSFQAGRLLPKEMLHRKIADKVWGAFIRGDFDTAVLLAMKAVEVAVRSASELGNDLVGVKLMRAAFSPENGPLTDMAAESGERQARMDFFAGAIGSYKNSHSHRDVNLDDPHEALEIVLLANHLLRIVDARTRCKAGKTT